MSTDDVTSNPEAPAEPVPGADSGDESVQDQTASAEHDNGSATVDTAVVAADLRPTESVAVTTDPVDATSGPTPAHAAMDDVTEGSDLDSEQKNADEAENIFGSSDGDDADDVASLFAVAFEHIRDEDEDAVDSAATLVDAETSAAATTEGAPAEGTAPVESVSAEDESLATPAAIGADDSAAATSEITVGDAEGSEISDNSAFSADAIAVSTSDTADDGDVADAGAAPTALPAAAAIPAPFVTSATTATPDLPASGIVSDAAPASEFGSAFASNGTDAEPPLGGSTAAWADTKSPATALTWVNPAAVSASTPTVAFSTAATEVAADDVLAQSRLRPAFLRSAVLVPLGTLVVLTAAYAGTMLLWPLTEVAPTVEGVDVEAVSAAPAALAWPAEGAAAIGVEGMSSLASTGEELPIASISKVVSSLMVLDAMPLQPGETGPEYAFTYGDNLDYWTYRSQDQSALDVPVDGVLTEYQLLQGTLIGSANNYIDHLADDIWSTDSEFADAAEEWLGARGLGDITIRTPSGFDDRNVATPGALLSLSEKALQNPVVAEIVATQSVELPGAGLVVNTNGMLADPGVIGVKTGTLEEDWNLLTAKEITVDDTTVRLHVAALGQVDDEKRLEVTRSLLAEVEAAINAQAPAVPAGTLVGSVQTMWGDPVDIVTESDAKVVLWNAATAGTEIEFDLGETREQDGAVGTLSVAGPIDETSVATVLTSEVEGPSAWWRLTHPLDLLGLND